MMKNFNLPPGVCAKVFKRAVDLKPTATAAERLDGQKLYEQADDLRRGCDLAGHCAVENCVAVVQLTQLGDGYVRLTDRGNTLDGCVELD